MRGGYSKNSLSVSFWLLADIIPQRNLQSSTTKLSSFPKKQSLYETEEGKYIQNRSNLYQNLQKYGLRSGEKAG